MDQEERRGLLESAPLPWVRGRASYRDSHIVLDRRQVEEYLPLGLPQRDELPFDLARIRVPDDALRFVAKHGLLFGEQPKVPPDGQLREPFGLWLSEARTANYLLNCIGRLRAATNGDESALRELRAIVNKAPEDALREMRQIIGSTVADGAPLTDYEVIAGMSMEVELQVNQRISSVRPFLLSEGRRGGTPSLFQVVYLAASPAIDAYLQLARLISASGPIVRCADPKCVGFFERRDPRQEYCTPACRNRANQRRFQAAKRATASGTPDRSLTPPV